MGAGVAGYSGKPLVEKLGLRPGQRVTFIDAPESLDSTLGPLPAGVERLASPVDGTEVILLFVRQRDALGKQLATLAARLAPHGMLWVAWPKRASRVPTDLSEDRVRELALPLGLVDVKVCAIDEVWSGLKLVRRRALR